MELTVIMIPVLLSVSWGIVSIIPSHELYILSAHYSMAEERKSGRNKLFNEFIFLFSASQSGYYKCMLYFTEYEAVQNSVYMEQEDMCICVEAKGQKICSPRGCGEYMLVLLLVLCGNGAVQKVIHS